MNVRKIAKCFELWEREALRMARKVDFASLFSFSLSLILLAAWNSGLDVSVARLESLKKRMKAYWWSGGWGLINFQVMNEREEMKARNQAEAAKAGYLRGLYSNVRRINPRSLTNYTSLIHRVISRATCHQRVNIDYTLMEWLEHWSIDCLSCSSRCRKRLLSYVNKIR